MTSQGYTDLFAIRGEQYDRAMQLYPSARDQEFLQAIQKVEFRNGMKIVDVPAGGEYLRRFLPKNSIYLPHEPCNTFYRQNKGSFFDSLLPLPFDDNQADLLFSIAGVHHLEDKTKLFTEFYRVLRDGGFTVVSDVYEDSPVAIFLDTYVGRYNTTGHKGIFLNHKTSDELISSGFSVVSETVEKFYWVFNDKISMGVFCNHLFDIQKTSVQNTIDAVDKYLGIQQLPNGQIGIQWELLTIVCQKINITK